MLKSLALLFRNWKCGIFLSFGELSWHKVESMDWLAKLNCNAKLAIQEIWASSSFILSWPSRIELRKSSILSWLIRVEPSLGLNLWSKRLKSRWTLALCCLSPNAGVWNVSPPCNMGNFYWVISIGILGFKMSPLICRCWVTWLGFEVFPHICRCWVTWLGFEVSPPICRYLVIWLGFKVSPPRLWILGCLIGVWSIL